MTITVSPSRSENPSPYVDVLVVPPAGVDHFTVTRTAAHRKFKVRGLVNVIAAGGGSIRDHEAGFNVPSTYQAEYFTGGLPTGFSAPAATTLYGLSPGWAWFSDPLDPTSAVKVEFLKGAAGELVRSTPGESLDVPRRSVGLTIPGTRGGLKQVVLDCYTSTRADGEKFDALFGDYDSDSLSIICIRALPETWLPPTLFAFVGSPAKRPLGVDGQRVYWAMQGDETTPPAPAFVTPLLTYQDFTDFYATYAQFTTAYPDYLTASRDYTIAGRG
ncbi:hypothetical protein E3O55_08510 [Cryobacterium sp. MDB1-18-2]|uniref:hypothetical protein n=1 Tax=unclassified Cryobacterium TaxID=2649013 RepID=UPI00106DC84E|nr:MULTISPECIES: hypothetical protein [unclassified Cryobacterium]TFC30115.1 hypothetical protein E3O55_08510 [Cryobacterium sp. MDB1-18-2]TFC41395.1 hypothetical protein E3O50_09950 [Cryobacterium sp. MDB1-18-1]